FYFYCNDTGDTTELTSRFDTYGSFGFSVTGSFNWGEGWKTIENSHDLKGWGIFFPFVTAPAVLFWNSISKKLEYSQALSDGRIRTYFRIDEQRPLKGLLRSTGQYYAVFSGERGKFLHRQQDSNLKLRRGNSTSVFLWAF